MTTSQTNRVGAGSTQPTPTPTSTSSPKNVSTQVIDDIIQGRLSGGKIVVDPNLSKTLVNPNLYDDMTSGQWSSIASLLKKLGKPVQGKEETKAILETYYGINSATMTTFKDLYSKLSADYIPGLDGGSGPSKTVNLQDPAIIDSIIVGTYQSMLKRDPYADELAARRKEVEAVILKGQTRTKTGPNEATYTPAFSQATAQEMVKSKIETGGEAVQTDLAQAQSLEFADFIGKLGK